MNRKSLFVVAIAFLLGGCASGVSRAPSVAGGQAVGKTYSQFALVSLSMSPEAKEKAIDNLKFNQNELLDHVKRALEAQSLIDATAGEGLPRIEVVVKDMRIRSNFSAVAFGFLAGADSIEGDIVLRDAAGRELDRFSVSASYALGGIGGLDSSRMSWLYEKFAEETARELKKQQQTVVSQR